MSRVQSMNDHEVYFVTLTVVEWADVFTRPSHVNILLAAFRYCQAEKGLVVFGYVIMSNHLHTILMSRQSGNSLNVDMRAYPAGAYLLTLIANDHIDTQRIVKADN
jgi:putative transposase